MSSIHCWPRKRESVSAREKQRGLRSRLRAWLRQSRALSRALCVIRHQISNGWATEAASSTLGRNKEREREEQVTFVWLSYLTSPILMSYSDLPKSTCVGFWRQMTLKVRQPELIGNKARGFPTVPVRPPLWARHDGTVFSVWSRVGCVPLEFVSDWNAIFIRSWTVQQEFTPPHTNTTRPALYHIITFTWDWDLLLLCELWPVLYSSNTRKYGWNMLKY